MAYKIYHFFSHPLVKLFEVLDLRLDKTNYEGVTLEWGILMEVVPPYFFYY